MKKIFFPIFIFLGFISCGNSVAMEEDNVSEEKPKIQYTRDQLLDYKNPKLTLKLDQLIAAAEAECLNYEEFFNKYTELGNKIILELEQELTIQSFQKEYFIHLLKQAFDQKFLKDLIMQQYLNLSKWEINGVERVGLRWLLQEAFAGCARSAEYSETNFVVQKFIPELVRFFSNLFVVRNVNLSNNGLLGFPTMIYDFPNVTYVIV